MVAVLTLGGLLAGPASATPATRIDLTDVDTSITVGQSDTVKVHALDAGVPDAGYTGTVTFSASCGDCFTITPNNGGNTSKSYTFVAADAGRRQFTVTWLSNAAGTQSLTASGTLAGGGTSPDTVVGIRVYPSAATKIFLSNVDGSIPAGAQDSVIVSATNAVYVQDKAYGGTVTFSATCGACFKVTPNNGTDAPTSYTYTPADEGQKTFAVTWLSSAVGPQRLTATGTLAGGGTSEWTADVSVSLGPASMPGRFTPLPPARIADTRDGTGGVTGPLHSGNAVDFQISGRAGVPEAGASAVVLNVTVTQPTSPGYLTLYPSGTPQPLASNLNFAAGETIPNLVVVRLGTGGKVAIFNSDGATHVVLDVAGWYSEDEAVYHGRFQPLAPTRILDTRTGVGGGTRLGPGQSLDVQVTGQGGMPSAPPGLASAVVLNVAVTNTTAASWLTVHPTGGPRPLASNLNFVAGDTVSNRVMVPPGPSGMVTIYNQSGSTDVIVDLGGWYTGTMIRSPSGTFTALSPARILDTRYASQPIAAGSKVDVQVAGEGGIPASGARAVVLNVTVTQPAAPGWLTIFPAGTAMPLASDLNYDTGETRPNLVVVQLGADGKVGLFASATTHVVFDVAGWFS